MTKEDVAEHIRMERNSGEKYDGEVEGAHCKQCGLAVNEDEQHIVHHVPEHGGDELHAVYYCGVSCFKDHMDELFSL